VTVQFQLLAQLVPQTQKKLQKTTTDDSSICDARTSYTTHTECLNLFVEFASPKTRYANLDLIDASIQ